MRLRIDEHFSRRALPDRAVGLEHLAPDRLEHGADASRRRRRTARASAPDAPTSMPTRAGSGGRLRPRRPSGPRRRRGAARRSVSNSTPAAVRSSSQMIDALREARVVLGRRLVRVVVQEDDVQVRGVAEFLAAELAVGDHREARQFAVARARAASSTVSSVTCSTQVGEVRQMVGEPLDRQVPREVLREQPKHCAWCASRSTSICRSGSPRRTPSSAPRSCAANALQSGRVGEHARVEQLVEQDRMAVQVFRGPARCAHQLGELGERLAGARRAARDTRRAG